MGTSCFLHTPLYHSLFPSSSSSSSSSQSFLLHSRNGSSDRKKRTAMACMPHGSPDESFECKRRAILFMGISVLPFLNLRATAFKDLATSELGFGNLLFFPPTRFVGYILIWESVGLLGLAYMIWSSYFTDYWNGLIGFSLRFVLHKWRRKNKRGPIGLAINCWMLFSLAAFS